MTRQVQFHRAAPQLTKREDGTPQKITGYASVFYDNTPGTEYELWPGVVERIMPEAFARAISEDDVRGLYNHDANQILGRNKSGSMRLFTDDKGLGYEITIDPTSPVHQTVVSALARKDVDGSSFAFTVLHEERIVEKDDRVVYLIREVKLYDVGPVVYPAYENTTAELRSMHIARRKSQEEQLGDCVIDAGKIVRGRLLQLRARAVEVESR